MANNNFTNFVTQYNKKPVAVNQPQTPAGLYPQKPAGLNPQQPVVSSTPVSLAQQAVNKGYVKSVDEYNQAENAGRALALPKVINSDTLKSKGDMNMPEYPTAPTNTRIQTGADTTPPPVITPPTEEKPLTLKEQTQKYLQDQITGGGAIDTLKIKEDANLRSKEKLATDLYNRQLTTKARFDKQIEALEKNPEGKLSGNLTQQINQVSREANRELADIALQYKIANDDYTGAAKVVEDQIADLKDQRDYTLKVLATSMDFLQNDLTESEKMELAQQYKLEEIAYDNEIKTAETAGKNAVLEGKALNYQNLLDTGQIAMKDVPADVMGYINTQGYVSPEQRTAKTQVDSLVSSFDQFRKIGATGAVGAPVSKILPYIGSLVGIGNYNADKSLVQNIKAQLTLNNLSFLKGAMSDKDIAFITQASSSLNENMSESQFKKELINIQGKFTNGILNSPAYSFEEKEQALTKQLKLEYPKATPEEILDLVDQKLPQSFSSAGNASASTIANAIKTVESQGNYNAKGASGESGAYQFMPSTWKQWAGEYLGDPNAPLTRENQDFVAQSKINSLLEQGYNPEQIALIWNGGTPKRKAGVNKYGVQYDSGAYADKVLQTLTA